jgi:hypothetical protein
MSALPEQAERTVSERGVQTLSLRGSRATA